MQESQLWRGLPFYPISGFYKQRFGSKVFRIPVSIAETCPNREGLKGMKVCIFCDEWGSAAYPEERTHPLLDQLRRNKEKVQRRTNADNFFAYFQAYTNTFTRVSKMRENFELAFNEPYIVGAIVGTRPDCISKSVIELWQEYHEKKFVSVEIGVQSFVDTHMEWMRRGHSVQKSIDTILRIKNLSNVDLGIHLMFGLPGETDEQLIQTARLVSSLPIDNVKLHNLHVLKGTPLEVLYAQGKFVPLELEEYTRRVALFIEHLSPKVAIQRLAAVSSRKEELIAPAWTGRRMDNYQYIVDYLNKNQIHQGQKFLGTQSNEIKFEPKPLPENCIEREFIHPFLEPEGMAPAETLAEFR